MGCLIFVCLLLGFAHPGWWVAAFVLMIIAGNSQSSSSSASGSSSSSDSSSATATLSPHPPDDLDNLLVDISRGQIKDPVTQEIFQPGQKVYLCYTHRLAYHEDSWKEMGCKCMVCNHDRMVKAHILPVPIDFKKRDLAKELGIEFRDLE